MTRTHAPCHNLTPYQGLPIERLSCGKPIIAPTDHWWEDGVTFNTASVYLSRSPGNDPLIARLLGQKALADPRCCDGVVAAHYRARPKHDHGYRWTRSFTGLAILTPDTSCLLARFPEPVICPAVKRSGEDYLGIEDPRITQIDGVYYAVYCGVGETPHHETWKASICFARSTDLLHWEKLGVARGSLNCCNNKDGVLFPEQIDGYYLMLHRPMLGMQSGYSMDLAIAESLTGEWHDCGAILSASQNPQCRSSWVGAGSVPIPLGNRRYLVIFHTGNYLTDGRKEYDLDAAILNFNNFDPAQPSALVESRIDRIMVPETDCEINGPYHDSVANVLFTCGTYVYGEYLYILYGGGDTFVMSARVRLQALLDALERSPVRELALA